MKKIFFVFSIIICINAAAQKKETADSLRQSIFSAQYNSGFIFAHNIHVQNTKGVKPDGFELQYSHLKTDSFNEAKFRCYPRLGLSFTYIDFNSRILGKGYSLSYFIEPNYRLTNRLLMNVHASIGLSYLTSPHDSVKNPTNESYSGHINTFLQLDVGFSYPLSNKVAVFASGNFYHNSNGGFKLPNAGVNYINASVGLHVYQYSTKLPVYKRQKDTLWKQQPFHVDGTVFYSPKDGYNADSSEHRKFVLGAAVMLSKQVSSMDALTAAAEIYYDDGLRSIKDVYVKDNSSATLAGVLIGHQFLLNRFIFSQQIGFYISKHTQEYKERYSDLFHEVYHRWGLNYKINDHLFAGIMLLAHDQIADFVDARITYRFR